MLPSMGISRKQDHLQTDVTYINPKGKQTLIRIVWRLILDVNLPSLRDVWWSIVSGYDSKSVFGEDLLWASVPSEEDPSSMWEGNIQSAKSLSGTKRQKKGEFPNLSPHWDGMLFSCHHRSELQVLQPLDSETFLIRLSEFLDFRHWTESYIIHFLDSLAFQLGLSHASLMAYCRT